MKENAVSYRDVRAAMKHCDELIDDILERLTELRVWLNNQQSESYADHRWEHHSGLFVDKLNDLQAIVGKQSALIEHWVLCRASAGYRTTPAITDMHNRIVRVNRLVKAMASQHFPTTHERYNQIFNEACR